MSESPKGEEKEDQGQPKVETEEQPKKKVIDENSKQSNEPEPKIPTDITGDIERLEKIKDEGNNLFKDNNIDGAIEKYNEGYKEAEKIMDTLSKESDYNPQYKVLKELKKKLMQNLALSYSKKGEYKKAIDIDTKIIAIDKLYDKSYYRLFSSHRALGNRAQAIYFGQILKSFPPETTEKFSDVLPEIEKEIKENEREINELNAKKRKENIISIAKYSLPIVVLVSAGLIYFYFFRK